MKNRKEKPEQNTEIMTAEKVRDHLLRAGQKGNSFQFRKDYVNSKLFTRAEALFLQDLMDIGARKTNNGEIDSDGFFQCTEDDLWQSLRWDLNSQRRFLDILIEKNIITIKRAGKTAKRWVLIHWKHLARLLEEATTN